MADHITKEVIQELMTSLSSLQYQITKILENNGPMTRNEIVKDLKSARTTIYDNLIRLERMNILQKFNKRNRMSGRPLVYWRLV